MRDGTLKDSSKRRRGEPRLIISAGDAYSRDKVRDALAHAATFNFGEDDPACDVYMPTDAKQVSDLLYKEESDEEKSDDGEASDAEDNDLW